MIQYLCVVCTGFTGAARHRFLLFKKRSLGLKRFAPSKAFRYYRLKITIIMKQPVMRKNSL